VQVGDTLQLLPPSGEFVLAESDKPVVLISGGVGITPTLAMLEQALATEREVVFIHCARNGDVHAFREQIEAAAARIPQLQRFYCYDEVSDAAAPAPHAVGRLDLDRLNEWLPSHTRDVDAYFLGPKPFMQQVRRGLRSWGVPDAQSRFEFFGPASALE
jgi:nitric oxide dioxygenase